MWVVPFLSGLCQLELLLQCPKVLPTPYDILSRGLLYELLPYPAWGHFIYIDTRISISFGAAYFSYNSSGKCEHLGHTTWQVSSALYLLCLTLLLTPVTVTPPLAGLLCY